MKNSDIAISIRGLTKVYAIHAGSKPRTFGELVANRLRHPFHRAESESFFALSDVSFDVKHGEVVGIIGRNGAGKSTLLKLLSRITEPTSGNIKLFGRVGSLLEVGTGFHPELTGRENIFLNGAILGMSRAEIRSQFDAIVDFAEVEKFLETPVKRYSSGMYVRLAFAVAAHLNPEILIIDEVLAVGDMQFQQKCLGKMGEVARGGRTVLFVSHNMAAIKKLCTRCVVLKRGEVEIEGSPDQCINTYLQADLTADVDQIIQHGRRRSDLVDVEGITINGVASDSVVVGSNDRDLNIVVRCAARHSCPLNLEVRIADHMGMTVGTFSPGHLDGITRRVAAGKVELSANLPLPKLSRGTYLLSIYLTDPNVVCYWEFYQCVRLRHEGHPTPTGQVFESGAHWGALMLDGSIAYQAVG